MGEKWIPRKYQKRSVRFFVERAAAGLLADPGLGKTSVTFAALLVLQKRGILRRALVVAPLRVCHSTWIDERDKWTDFAGIRVVILHGSKKDKLLNVDADVYVINPEGLNWLSTRWRGWQHAPEMLVIDESTKFKHTRTQRFKTLKALLPRFTRRYILTGTPVPNGLIDLFGQIYIPDFGESLGRYITHYRRMFFDPTGFGGYTWKPREGAEESIYEKLTPLVLRIDEKDHLELPEKVMTNIGVTLPPKARARYDTLKDDFIMQLHEGAVVASNVGALTAKLRQASSGAVYLTDVLAGRPATKDWANVHDAKLEALKDLVEELSGQPLLIAYEFRFDIIRIRAALAGLFPDGEPVPAIGGGTTAKQGKVLVDRWNRQELTAMLVHPASASHGLNLQEGGRHLVWYGMTYNLEHYDQLIRRIWRQGQKKRVFIYHLIARNTIDATIMKAIRSKDKTQRALLNALREENHR